MDTHAITPALTPEEVRDIPSGSTGDDDYERKRAMLTLAAAGRWDAVASYVNEVRRRAGDPGAITREFVEFLIHQANAAEASDTRCMDAPNFRDIAAILGALLPPE